MQQCYSINELLEKFVGHTDIACDSNYDDISSNNLEILNEIMWWCIDRLQDNAKWIGDYRASANYLAKKCIKYCENYKKNIDYIVSLNGDNE